MPRFLNKKQQRNRQAATVEPGPRIRSGLQQIWKDQDTNRTYIINADDGSWRVDTAGNKVKNYYNNVTGISDFNKRNQQAQQRGKTLCEAKVP